LSTKAMWFAHRLVPSSLDPLLAEVVRRFRRSRVPTGQDDLVPASVEIVT
jgi:hypothetical protein